MPNQNVSQSIERSARNYGIDILRIVSMLMVVMLHVLGRGGILAATSPMSANYMVAWIMEICAYCAVNCYALVSGYVGYTSKHKCSGLIQLTFEVIFYVVAITGVSYFIFPNVSMKEFISSLLHIRSGGYWYYKAYLGAFFFFPLINIAVEKTERGQAKKFIVVILVLYSLFPILSASDLFSAIGGYSPIWMLIMYFIGAYIRKYDIASEFRAKTCIAMYGASVLVTFVSFLGIGYLTTRVLGKSVYENILISYTSPAMVLCGVSLLLFFSKIKVKSGFQKIIAFVTPLTFGVYLIHMQYFIREWLTNRFVTVASLNPFMLFLAVIGIVLAIYTACIIIGTIRSFIFKLFRVKTLSEKIAKLFRLA